MSAIPTPPHARDSERGILARTLEDPQALKTARSLLSAEDFYVPAHAEVWAIMCELDDAGGFDPAAVAETMRLRGSRALDVLPALVGNWDVSDVEWHCRRLIDATAGRGLLQAAQRLLQKLPSTEDPVGLAEEVIDALRLVQRSSVETDTGPLDVVDLVQRQHVASFVVPGLLARTNRIVITAPEGYGKALAVDTPVPTPKGWRTMGDLAVGDEVFSPSGRPTQVIAVTEPLLDRPCYRIRFSDDATIVADAAHQWLTETYGAREAAAYLRRRGPTKPRGTDQRHRRMHFPAVVTTEEIERTLKAREGHCLNHSIVTCEPLQYPAQDLPLDPYLLGAWLGDGTTSCAALTIHPDDGQILDRIRAAGYPLRKRSARYGWGLSDGVKNPNRPSVQRTLRLLGVLGDKHIPAAYLHASVAQRLALLQGLMDTDGTVGLGASPVCELSLCCERLARDAQELLLGLGIKVPLIHNPTKLNGRVVGTRWRLNFQTELPVFHLARKAERLKPLRTRRAALRYIYDVQPVPAVPVRCIQVAAEDGLFVVGRECIPTHNSSLLRQVGICAAAGVHPFKPIGHTHPRTVLVVDAENPSEINTAEYGRLFEGLRGMDRAPERNSLYVDECGPLDLLDGRQAARLYALVERLRPDLICIGPIYQLHTEDPNEERAARKLAAVLDRLRLISGAALVTEAHTPHNDGAQGQVLRPYGASLWKRWPEFGYCLHPTVRPRAGVRLTPEEEASVACRESYFTAWRGNRAARAWPSRLSMGRVLLWEEA